MEPIDLNKIRLETRGCSDLIHFKNAGASLMPVPVADYLYCFLQEEELKGGYETAAARKEELENFYTAAAQLLHAKPV